MEKIYEIDEYKVIKNKEFEHYEVSPSPKEDELKKIYEEEYYSEVKKSYIDETLEDLQWWQTIYADKYSEFEKYIKNSDRKILDIGCGSGYFLKFGRQRGWNTVGVEPSKKASLHAIRNGSDVKNALFSNDLFEENSFDVVHMHDVLEHVLNPVTLIENVKYNLKNNGILCIGVPNEFNPLQNILWKEMDFKPWWICPPHHLNYFTPDSLTNILQKSGFDIFLKETTFPMELFLLMGDDYINNPKLGRSLHFKRKNFDLTLSKYNNKLKRDLYRALANLNVGREIIIYARKK